MHEVGIMEEALGMAMETVRSSGASRLLKLRLRVGLLSGVVPEALRFAFEAGCCEPMTQGAQLDIETVAPSCWCAVCHAEFECNDVIAECPGCRNVTGELRHGRELEIASVEVC
jgi:hydrogenase nickel incorporation protein HypA/HybF